MLGRLHFSTLSFSLARFITGQHADSLLTLRERGFLAFLRLIRTLYFKKYISAMASLKNVETPLQLFNSFEESCSKAKHEAWYNAIMGIVSERSKIEYHQIHQCGITGSAAVGWDSCEAIHHK